MLQQLFLPVCGCWRRLRQNRQVHERGPHMGPHASHQGHPMRPQGRAAIHTLAALPPQPPVATGAERVSLQPLPGRVRNILSAALPSSSWFLYHSHRAEVALSTVRTPYPKEGLRRADQGGCWVGQN